MAKVVDGSLDGRGKRIGIAVARFNELVTQRMLDGALATLRENGVADDAIDVAWVPGAFELPAACRVMWDTGRFDALVMLGAVIRGETDHYDHVCSGVTHGAMRLASEHGAVLGFGLLTCATMELALARAGGAAGNKGADAAQAALAMTDVRTRIADDAS